MEITFDCPQCGVKIEADSEYGGDQVDCPACQNTLLVPAAGIDVGTHIAGFEVIKRLGIGGMGEVFLARQLAMDRTVALKVLPPAMTKNKELLKRFLQEVRTSGKLEHPNIVTAFDAGEDSGYHYLAMSFVDGEDLDQQLDRDGRLREADVLAIGAKVAVALDYAWNRHRLLHRDIKPSNIMVDRDGAIRLMDMGIAKSLSEDSNLTMAGLFVGTPFYMSPEQAKSAEDIDFRSDIYSLGATMYHLLTGTRPFDGPSAVAVLSKHLSEPVVPLLSRNAELSVGTNQLVLRMMEKDRDHRHDSWQALIEDIAQRASQLDDRRLQVVGTPSSGASIAEAPTIIDQGSPSVAEMETIVAREDGAPGTAAQPAAPADPDATIGLADGTVAPQGAGTVPAGASPAATAPAASAPAPAPAPAPAATPASTAPAPTPARPADAVTITIPKVTDLSPGARWAVIGVVLVLAGMAVFWLALVMLNDFRKQDEAREREREQRQVEHQQDERGFVADVDANLHRIQVREETKLALEAKREQLDQMLAVAEQTWRREPHDVAGALRLFRKVEAEGKGTPVQLKAAKWVGELEAVLKAAQKAALAMGGSWQSVRCYGDAYTGTPKRVGLIVTGTDFRMTLDTRSGSGSFTINGDRLYLVLPGKAPKAWGYRQTAEALTLSPEDGVFYELRRAAK
jgi:serine/threonine-protein kinase